MQGQNMSFCVAPDFESTSPNYLILGKSLFVFQSVSDKSGAWTAIDQQLAHFFLPHGVRNNIPREYLYTH